MWLLVYLVILFFFFHFRKPMSPGLLLILIYMTSLFCAIVVGHDYAAKSGFEAFNIVFLGLTLSIFMLPWNKFRFATAISEPDPVKVKHLTNVLLVINGIAFLVFATICFYAFSEIIDFSAFKNGGESSSFVDRIPLLNPTISHGLYLLASYLHSSAYFLVPLHFYYLSKKKTVLCVLCLVFSANIVLYGLTVFSRSTLLIYLLIYCFNLPFFFKKLENRSRKIIMASAFTLLCLAVIPFAVITANRFSNVVAYDRAVSDQALISSPEIYSLFDYGSQWFKNGNEVMATYSFDTLNGELSFPFLLTVADKLELIDYPPEKIELTLRGLWGDHFDRFNGLVANLLFDFGYIGTILFALGYALLLLRLGPVRGELPFTSLMILGGLFILPASGIFNSQLKTVSYDTLILYSIVAYGYMNQRRNANTQVAGSLQNAVGVQGTT